MLKGLHVWTRRRFPAEHGNKGRCGGEGRGPQSADHGHKSVRATTRAWFTHTVTLILLTSSVFAGAQIVPSPDDQFDVSVEDLQVPDAIVPGEDNEIQATIENHGRIDMDVTVEVQIVDTDGKSWSESRDETVDAEESVVVVFIAPGTSNENPMRGEATVSIEVFVTEEEFGGPSADPDPDNNQKEATREVHQHSLAFEVINTTAEQTEPDPIGPGQKATTIVWITNGGNAQDVLSFSFSDGSEGWAFQASPTSMVLDEGEEKQVTVTMQAPVDALQDEKGAVTFVASSSEAPKTGGKQRTLYSPAVEATGTIASILDPADSGDSVPEEQTVRTATYNLSVHNAQNREIRVTPFVNAPSQWGGTTTISPSSERLIVDEVFNFSIEIEILADAPAGSHLFETGGNWIDPEDPDDGGQLQSADFTLHVPEWKKVDFDLGPGVPSRLEPGLANAFPFLVENNGNHDDSFSITLIDAPFGWHIVDATTGDVASPFTVLRGEQIDPDLALKIPSTAEPEDLRGLIFQVASEGGDATDKVQATVKIPERVYPHILIGECPTEPCAIDADDAQEIPVTISNIGNVGGTIELVADIVQKLGPSDDGTNEDGGWTVAVEPASVTLDSEQSSSAVTVTVHSPDPDDGALHPRDAVVIDLVARASGETHQGNESIEGIGVVAAFPDLAIDANVDHTPTPLYREAPGNMVITIRNEGTKDAGAFGVEVSYSSSQNDDDVFETKEVQVQSLAVDEETTRDIPIPTDAGFSKMWVTIEADPDDQVPEYLAVQGAASNTHAKHELELRLFNIAITSPTDMTVDPGQRVAFEDGFLVANRGEHAETMDVSLTMDTGWAQESWSSRSLASEDSEEYGTTFFVPGKPDDLEAVVTLTVSHSSHPSLSYQDSFTIHVTDTAPPEIDIVAPNNGANVSRGQTIDFQADIWDATGVESAHVVFFPPSGGEKHTSMTFDDSSGLYHAEIPLTDPGEYEWYVWAKDSSADAKESDTSDSKRTLNVSATAGTVAGGAPPAGSKPALTLMMPLPGDVIKPGDMVRISVSNTTGIQSASVTVLGVTETIATANPLDISTDQWPDGVVQAAVNVTDVYGEEIQETFSIQVDGDAPKFGEVTIDDTSPGQATAARLVVTDNTGVASVKLRVDAGAGGGAKDITMAADGDGYIANFTYPAESGSVTAIAQDTAGNTASKTLVSSQASVDQAGTQAHRTTPAPAWIIGVVVLLGAAWIAERRRMDDEGGR